jgi:hypothetical protein
MSEDEQTKVCPRCAETIKAAAKVCPHCRRPQKRAIFISEHEAYALGAVLFFGAAMFLALWFFTTGRQYSPQKYRISVLNADFGVEAASYATNEIITNIIASGVLTNESVYSWKVTGFEVRFLDEAGKTVDVGIGGSEYDDLIVLPHSDHAFHVALHPMKSVPTHAGYKVTVTEASDPNYLFGD